MAWTCPECGRSFGRRDQPHSCVPAANLAAWLAGRPRYVGEVVEAVRSYVEGLGDDVRLEATKAALMVKRARTFAEVKPRRDRTEVAFILGRRLDDPRIVRTLDLTRTRIVHVVDCHKAADLDSDVRSWLREAYEDSPL
jgi:hypothetical protein